MTGRVAVNTDLNFVQGLMLHGAADLKKYYQCSTCTVACPLTPNDEPFPRKEMPVSYTHLTLPTICSV